jgi:hypothetical protein
MGLMRHIKVMPDYDCWPLWHDGPPFEDVGDIDPMTLQISASIRARLLAWANAYDLLLNRDDPSSTPAPDPSFDAEGRDITDCLQQELGRAIRVRYWKDVTRSGSS